VSPLTPPARVALFVPCYIDQLYPGVGWAALELLEAHGITADVLDDQTCCGQPLINTGAVAAAQPLFERFAATFRDYEHVVCPSGSCCATLRRGLLHAPSPPARPAVFELCEYLVEVLGVERIDASFPHRVVLHQSCHALRELGLGLPSELGGGAAPRENPGRKLLRSLRDVTLVEPERGDECCGFGGSFCITEASLSGRMGRDRVDDLARSGATVVTSLDMSCLMHLSGVSRRERRPLAFMHIAEVLAGRAVSAGVAPGAAPEARA
jgi:L-lactate dehydrogenase complex protein LldE